MKYSIYKIIYYVKGKEVVETMFFEGLLRWKVNTATDWRFKEIPGVRSQGWFVGVAVLEFPVQYPIRCTDGTLIHKDGKLQGQRIEDMARQRFDVNVDHKAIHGLTLEQVKTKEKHKIQLKKNLIKIQKETWNSGFKRAPDVSKHYLNQEGDEACYYCEKLISGKLVTKDHIYPAFMGFGLHKNKAISCPTCNNFKDRLTPEQFVEHITYLLEYEVDFHDLPTVNYLSLVKNNAEKLINKDVQRLIGEIINETNSYHKKPNNHKK